MPQGPGKELRGEKIHSASEYSDCRMQDHMSTMRRGQGQMKTVQLVGSGSGGNFVPFSLELC